MNVTIFGTGYVGLVHAAILADAGHTVCCIDIEAVRKGLGSDPHLGYPFIYPGCGYGDSCFQKDLQALEQIKHQS